MLADRICQCELIEAKLGAIDLATHDELRDTLAQHRQRIHMWLFGRSRSSCGDSSSSHQTVASPRDIVLRSGLILQALHVRDAVASHFESTAKAPITTGRLGTFGICWDLQLKHRFDDSTTVGASDCHVEMNGLKVPYGFHYANPLTDSVVTPATLRSLFALAACIRNAQSVLIAGPAQSGKTHLALQVSRLLGRQSFSTTASAPTQLAHVLMLLRGALHAGGTFCLRLPPVVTPHALAIIRVVAATLGTIEHCVLTKLPITGLQRDAIAFVPGTALLLTRPRDFSPLGSGARDVHALTEHLSRLEVLACDDALILEAILDSRGFEAPHAVARTLSTLLHHVRASSNALTSPQDVMLSLRVLKTIVASVAVKVAQTTEAFERAPLQLYLLREAIAAHVTTYASKSTVEGDNGSGRKGDLCSKSLDEWLALVFGTDDQSNEWYVKQWSRCEAEAAASTRDGIAQLRPFIETAATSLHLVPRHMLVQHAETLMSGLVTATGVVLTGASGTGKTTTYTVVAKALELYKHHVDETNNAAVASTSTGASRTLATGEVASTNKPSPRAASHLPAPVPPSPRNLPQKTSAATAPAGLKPSTTTHESSTNSEGFVSVHVVLPMALTLTQLYGSTAPDGKGRTKSVLGRLIRLAQEQFAPVRASDASASFDAPLASSVDDLLTTRSLAPLLTMQSLVWVVFDSALEHTWLEYLSCVLQRKCELQLMPSASATDVLTRVQPFEDGESMTIPPNLQFLFETLSMQHCAPSTLQLNAVVCFDTPTALDNNSAEPPASSHAHEPIHRSYIRRYLRLQRVAWTLESHTHSALALRVLEIIETRLLDLEILDAIDRVIEEYRCSVRLSYLQRVTNLLALLQALLSAVAATTSDEETAVPPAPSGTSSGDAKSSVAVALQLTPDQVKTQRLETRVDMTLVFAIMWGFASGVNANASLQLLVHGMLKTHFAHIAETWASCGKDASLFETLLDLPHLRFVSVHACLHASASLPRHTADDSTNANVSASIGPATFTSSSLFVPTSTSVLVHAVMQEAVRAGRGVVLVGHENARRTRLLRNFLQQLPIVNTAVRRAVSASASDESATDGEHATGSSSVATQRHKNGHSSGVPAAAAVANEHSDLDKTIESVERIRFHQISLVTALAAKFRRLQHESALTAAANAHPSRQHSATPPVGATAPGASEAPTPPDDVSTPMASSWTIDPGFPASAAYTASKLASGDVVPFFFTMNRFTHGVAEIAQCMERMLQRERTGVFEPPPGKLAVLILDDLHLSAESEAVASSDLLGDNTIDNGSGLAHDAASCHEYLRSVYEHASVCAGDDAAVIRIEHLVLVASVAPSTSATYSKHNTATNDGPFGSKLVRQLFPVVAPPCSALELHHIFMTLCLAQWDRPQTSQLERLPHIVRHALPLIVAATTVLWQKLSQHPWPFASLRQSPVRSASTSSSQQLCFRLHDLARVYDGICSVAPSYVLDIDTLLRLWTHECLCAFASPFEATHASSSVYIARQTWRLRRIVEAMDHRHDSAPPNRGVQRQDSKLVHTDHLNAGLNAVGYLTYLSTEFLDKKAGPASVPAATNDVAQHTIITPLDEPASLWGFVASDLYYQQRLQDAGSSRSLRAPLVPPMSSSSAPTTPRTDDGRRSSRPQPLQRGSSRSNFNFIRRKSLHAVTSSTTALVRPWIYAELIAEDATEIEVQTIVQQLFGALRTYSTAASTAASSLNDGGSHRALTATLQLPKHAPRLSLSVVRAFCLSLSLSVALCVCRPPQ